MVLCGRTYAVEKNSRFLSFFGTSDCSDFFLVLSLGALLNGVRSSFDPAFNLITENMERASREVRISGALGYLEGFSFRNFYPFLISFLSI